MIYDLCGDWQSGTTILFTDWFEEGGPILKFNKVESRSGSGAANRKLGLWAGTK